MDENVDPAKFRRLCSVPLTWGLGCPVGVRWVGPGLGVCLAGLWVRALGKYLDPAEYRDRYGLRTRHKGVLNFQGPSLWLGGVWGHE